MIHTHNGAIDGERLRKIICRRNSWKVLVAKVEMQEDLIGIGWRQQL